MPKLVLIRGLPGSGKSTMAKTVFASHRHLEADQYFERKGQGYIYNPKEVPLAHKWCQKKAKILLDEGHDVVVSNTFVKRWEMEPYFKMGYPVHVVTATGAYANVHNVPASAIDQMKKRWEE